MNVFIIEPDGKVTPRANFPDPEKWAAFSLAVQDVLGGPLELVSVIFDGKPATLIVDEVGASRDPQINPGGQLPANARATAIYWTATIQGRTPIPFNPLTQPMVHGTAILIERDKRYL